MSLSAPSSSGGGGHNPPPRLLLKLLERLGTRVACPAAGRDAQFRKEKLLRLPPGPHALHSRGDGRHVQEGAQREEGGALLLFAGGVGDVECEGRGTGESAGVVTAVTGKVAW